MSIGENIKKARGRMKQSELADMLKVDVSTISRWENDKNVPNSETLQKIAVALRTTGANLLGENNNSAHVPFRTSEYVHQALTLAKKIGNEDFDLKEPITAGMSEHTITITDNNTNLTYSFPNNEEGRKSLALFLGYSMGMKPPAVSNTISGNNNSGNKLGAVNVDA